MDMLFPRFLRPLILSKVKKSALLSIGFECSKDKTKQTFQFINAALNTQLK